MMSRVVYTVTVELGDGDKAVAQAQLFKDWLLYRFNGYSSTGDTTVHFSSHTLEAPQCILTYCELCLPPQPGFSFTVTRNEVG
jgi:hypothetical protein